MTALLLALLSLPATIAAAVVPPQPYEAPRLTRLFDHTQLTTPA